MKSGDARNILKEGSPVYWIRPDGLPHHGRVIKESSDNPHEWYVRGDDNIAYRVPVNILKISN